MSESTAARLGDEKFVSLTTFKRSGDAAASPMWIVRDGNQLLAWTPADAWKVKRIRRDPRVTLRPCGRTGKVCAPNNPSSPARRGDHRPQRARTARVTHQAQVRPGVSGGDSRQNRCGPRPQTASRPAYHAVEYHLTRAASARVRAQWTGGVRPRKIDSASHRFKPT